MMVACCELALEYDLFEFVVALLPMMDVSILTGLWRLLGLEERRAEPYLLREKERLALKCRYLSSCVDPSMYLA